MNCHTSRNRRENAGGPRRHSRHARVFWAILTALVAGEVAGCGGGSGKSATTTDTGAGAEQTYGLLSTRVIGTAQPPVVSAGTGAVITGVAGATFSSIVEANYGAKTLADTKFALYGTNSSPEDIYMMDVSGANIKNITHTPNIAEFSPTWSPDGKKIAFVRVEPEKDDHIFVMNPDGSNLEDLTAGLSGNSLSPSWSPDGTKIAFVRSNGGGNRDIWIMDAVGGNEVNITRSSDYLEDNPAWSPDGSRIVFTRIGGDYGNGDLATVRAIDGADLERLTTTPNIAEVAGSWSRDGKWIAFTAGNTGDNNFPSNPRIEKIDPYGNNRQQLTFPYDSFSDFNPTWSPDSTKVAFLRYSNQSSFHHIFVMNPDGTDLTDITPDANIGFEQAVWSGYLPRSPRNLVGVGGMLASACAGFLFGQQDKTITSIVTFDAGSSNRAKTRVEALTGVTPGVPNLVFSISAGDAQLTTLRFVNGYGRVNYVIGGQGGIAPAAGVLVSYSATDGTVTTVIPYSATKSIYGHRPSVTKQGDELILRGDFAAVIGRNGERISPGGLHEVRLDAKTGELMNTP